MKLKKRWQPEYTAYSITVVRPGGERLTSYNGCDYRSKASAQRDADRINERRDPRAGKAIVEERQVKAGHVWVGSLRL
jgi:hypothetical protein